MSSYIETDLELRQLDDLQGIENLHARFTGLVEKHGVALNGIANRLVRGTTIDPADVVQDGLLRAFAAMNEGRFIEQGKTEQWLFRIVRNTAFSSLRKKSHTNERPDNMEVFIDTTGQRSFPDPEDSVVSNSEVTGLLQSLSEERREVLALHLSGFSYNEIADELGIPIGTVRSRLSRAKKELRRDYSEAA
jgi:RNA polymerase sigma-70 factor (ECF subfamily)